MRHLLYACLQLSFKINQISQDTSKYKNMHSLQISICIKVLSYLILQFKIRKISVKYKWMLRTL